MKIPVVGLFWEKLRPFRLLWLRSSSSHGTSAGKRRSPLRSVCWSAS